MQTLRRMMDSLYDLEVHILLALNDWGGSAVDTFFYYASEKWYSLPLHIVLLMLLYKNFGWKKTLLSLVMIALMITISDQLAELFKDILVKRPRPCNPEALGDQISMIGKRCGTYGFYSAHASSSLALAVYIGLL
ncbi:MAG: hypothetical protein RQ756_08825 [Flavobacteriaceae bacterium]|nr:hypothetical protein [Flavobacteriaceae bacterium]